MSIKLGSNVEFSSKLVREIAQDNKEVVFSAETKKVVNDSRKIVDDLVSKKAVIYGITTGFGSFKDKNISGDLLDALQINLIRSHACGVGEPFSIEEVRAMMTIRLNSLIKGYSGVRFELVELVRQMLNKGVTPYVPSQGSVGASGDLAPLCHMGLVLAGEGEAYYKGVLMSGKKALEKAGLKPITFKAKEGLAWSNGTSVMTGLATLVIEDAKKISAWADIACAMTFEALRGCTAALDERVHKVRNQNGQQKVAKKLREILKGSKLINTELQRVQDSYTLRCSAQVHGACLDNLEYVSKVVENEVNAVTDNPIVFKEGDIVSGGNFHGEPIAIAMDSLAIGISEYASISERRTAKMIDPATNHGLPAFLIPVDKGGVCSGMMIPQYVSAALVSENKVLAHPASVDSIPTSANQEDHVSMGTISARKMRKIIENSRNVIAIELLNACQAIDFQDPKKLSPKTKEIYNLIRKQVKFADNDRVFSGDIKIISEIIKNN